MIMDQMSQHDEDLHEKQKYEELKVKIASYISLTENHLSNDHSSIKHLAAIPLNRNSSGNQLNSSGSQGVLEMDYRDFRSIPWGRTEVVPVSTAFLAD